MAPAAHPPQLILSPLMQNFFLVPLAVLVLAVSTHAQAVPCMHATFEDSLLVKRLRHDATDPASERLRGNLGVTRPIDPNTVEIVRDSVTCTRVTRALEARLGHRSRDVARYVIARFGSFYAAHIPGTSTTIILDSAFIVRRAWRVPD